MVTANQISMYSEPPNPATHQIESRIPPRIWDTLTELQKTAIHTAILRRTNNHIAAVRSSIGVGRRRYYIAFFFGRERRNLKRLREEGQLDPTEVSFIYICLGTLMVVFGIIFLAIFLYIVKSVLGIDIMDGPSPMHALICR